ncbi:unnamed protein product, partial [Mesocestoides corti]
EDETRDIPREVEERAFPHARIFTRSYIRRSRSRYRAVHRRQMDAMLRRTAWFLDSGPSPTSATAAIHTRATPQLVVTFEPSTTAALAYQSSGYTPTSTQSLIDIGRQLQHSGRDLETQLTVEGQSGGFCVSALPGISMTSIRSAPSCQVSPAISTRTDAAEDDDDDDDADVVHAVRSQTDS